MAKNSSSSRGSGRVRNFATVVYPESAQANWLDVLSELKVPAFVSPLHDCDCNPDGEKKKAHYHVIFAFDSVKTEEQARACAEAINGVGLEVVKSMRSHCRYLCHLDNPEKAQYSPDDVKAFGGLDYLSAISSGADRREMIREMMVFISTNQVYSFAQFCLYCADNNPEWFYSITENSTYVIGEFIRSINYDLRNGPPAGLEGWAPLGAAVQTEGGEA